MRRIEDVRHRGDACLEAHLVEELSLKAGATVLKTSIATGGFLCSATSKWTALCEPTEPVYIVE